MYPICNNRNQNILLPAAAPVSIESEVLSQLSKPACAILLLLQVPAARDSTCTYPRETKKYKKKKGEEDKFRKETGKYGAHTAHTHTHTKEPPSKAPAVFVVFLLGRMINTQPPG